MPCAGAFPFAYCTKAILCLALGHSHLFIAPRPFYALRWRILICLSHQGHSMPSAGALQFAHPAKAIAHAVRPSLFYCCTIMVCFYQASCCWVLIYQESSSFALLGTHSSLSPEHSYCYCAKAAICCNSSLSLATGAPFFCKDSSGAGSLQRLFCHCLSVVNMIAIECS